MKTEELTALGLTEEQTAKVFALYGQEVNPLKTTIATLTADRDGLKSQLGAANGKLEGYDPEWKTKAGEAERLANEKIAALQYEFAAKNAASSLKFSSESAREAFTGKLVAKKLPMQNDKLLGYDDFVKEYRQADPGAFLGDTKPPRFTSTTPGPAQDKLVGNEKANAALREAFGRKGE